MLIIEFFSRPRWGEMLIETVIKNGPRAPEEVYPAALRGEINITCCWKRHVKWSYSPFFLTQIFTQKKLRLFISFDLRNFSVKSAGRELSTRTIF
jgi:hypothetical protein